MISRWAPRLDGVVAERLYESYPDLLALLPDVELTGNLPPVIPDGFSGYTHRPGELVEEIAEAELSLEDSSVSRGCPLRSGTCRPGWLTLLPGMSCWTPRGPSNAFLNYWA